MYRTGHGDCFLLAFDGEVPGKPVYVLIDCGYKPGSPAFIGTSIKDIGKNILAATGGHIDVAVITHEHQDHVNGITDANFTGITIGQTWLAWTEDESDELANALRKQFRDQLIGLLGARNHLAASGDAPGVVKRVEEALSFELGGEDVAFNAAAAAGMLGAAGSGSMNKKSMKIFKDLARNGVKCLRPHSKIISLKGTPVRVFVLGPPRDAELLKDLDPRGSEEFHLAPSVGSYFAAAAGAGTGLLGAAPPPPFEPKYRVAWDSATTDPDCGEFFSTYYGSDKKTAGASNPPWRRIDKDWLFAADQLALAMNNQTNNASLVLAFELGKGGKVLLFAADAQRGNWVSWCKKEWNDDGKKITAKDLLSRTVLYKVGHHGSHNATLNGRETDESPNISWMGQGDCAREFTVMITAVREWAMQPTVAWDHPKPSIKEALLAKTHGRVFQTDTDADNMKKKGGSQADWDDFLGRTTGEQLYFDYSVMMD
jgi:hypothetical protein